jgi:tyrosyl-tRNA synthetase
MTSSSPQAAFDAQLKVFKRGTTTFLSPEELKAKLALGRPLHVKLGVDPTSPELHLGHSVVLAKLRALQDLGHQAVLIIGDFTARIGDPSGRDSTRPPLSEEQIAKNAATYAEQAFKILDRGKTDLRRNSEWLDGFLEKGLLDTLKTLTAQQILAREDFKERLQTNAPLTLLEMLYPVFQAYDSIAVKADVELGGNDQLTNLLMGRRLMETAGMKPQLVVTTPLLVGTDGARKMSKSYGNFVALNDVPDEMFGKILRISDELMMVYYELLTDAPLAEIQKLHPLDAKKSLAETIVARYHGPAAARLAKERFERVFSKRQSPEDAPKIGVPPGLALSEIIVRAGAAKSKNEARRLLSQDAVRLDGEKVAADSPLAERGSFLLQVGRRRFVRVDVE